MLKPHGIFMNRSEGLQMTNDSAINFTEQFVDRNASADVRLVRRREFAVTVGTHPTRHAPIVPQQPPLLI